MNTTTNSDIIACGILDLQSRLLETFKFVSCHQDNFDTYSVGFCALILESGSFFDSIAQNFIRERYQLKQSFSNESKVRYLKDKLNGDQNFNYGDYRTLFENELDLVFSTRRLALNFYDDRFFPDLFSSAIESNKGNALQYIIPFKNWGIGKADKWWNAFTCLKHDRTQNLTKASLANVLHAFGGLLIMFIFAHRQLSCSFSHGELYKLFSPEFLAPQGLRAVKNRAFKIC